MNVPDHYLVLLAGVSGVVIYSVLLLFTQSQLPLLAGVFVGSNMISRTHLFYRSVRNIHEWRQRRRFNMYGSGDSTSENHKYLILPESSKIELLSAIRLLDSYGSNSRNTNEKRKKLFNSMSWRQQKLCEDVGYMKKLKRIDQHIDKNQQLFHDIVEVTKQEYGLSYRDFDLLKKDTRNTSSSNYRVVETLGHFVRDWAEEGTLEIAPMLEYIKNQLDKVIPAEEAEKTCIVLPGSGLGRVAHEISRHRNYGAVHALEFSGVMHACNQYLYESKEGSRELFPYIHTCSNFLHTLSQFRKTTIPGAVPQPENLTLSLDDFRYFSIPDREKYKNIVVVSVFFIDTAENLMDYFDVINQITAPSKRNPVENGYWINVGPLKYGSAAQVELNSDEISQIRKRTGWNDLHTLNTLSEPGSAYCDNGVLGYITDKESMWQGYYGLTMWTSGQSGNKRVASTSG